MATSCVGAVSADCDDISKNWFGAIYTTLISSSVLCDYVNCSRQHPYYPFSSSRGEASVWRGSSSMLPLF